MNNDGNFFDEKLADFFDELQDLDNLPLLDIISDINERYSDFSYLGEGGIKIIHKCKDLKTGRYVAMASLKHNEKDQKKELFLKEARLTAALQHPNIIPLHDLGLKDGHPWFTMKLVSGSSLEQVLKNLKRGNLKQFVSLNERLDVFIKICDAIAYAHSRGVLHLDIKPDNIQISDYGDVLLCDWGLAKVMASVCDEELLECYTFNPKELDLTVDGLVKGSPGYMAPEQTRLIEGKTGPYTDIFSLGCILYKVLTLEVPFQGQEFMQIMKKTADGDFIRPRDIDPSIPQSLEAVCMKALSPRPEDRYESVIHLQKEITDYRLGFATIAEDASSVKLIRLWYNRNRTLSIASLIIFVISLFTTSITINNLKLEKLNAQQTAEKLKLTADKLQLENKYQQKFNKGAAPRFLNRAQVAFNSFNFKDAQNFCESAVELDPTLKEAWNLKGLLHLINEEFNASVSSFIKSEKSKQLLNIASKFKKIKSDDQSRLSVNDFIMLFKEAQKSNNNQFMGGLLHQKAYSKIDINQRIEFCKGIIKAHNQKSLKRYKGNKTLNFSYNTKVNSLDLSDNPWLQSATVLQNFPALSANFSNTSIKNFICFRNQPLRSLNVSGTKIIELHTLENNDLIALNISNTSISNLTKLKDLHSLKIIDISYSSVRDCAVLKDLKSLENLIIHPEQLSTNELEKMNPKIKIIISKNEPSP